MAVLPASSRRVPIRHSPKFETYREQIDGKYWFPVYTIANSSSTLKKAGDLRVKLTVKYEDYKRFKADTTITFGGEVTSRS